MPYGACDFCDRVYWIDPERLPQDPCPRCSQSLRLISREAALAHLHCALRKSMAASAQPKIPDQPPHR
jgi:uncharacterized protein with PIN domain